MQRANVKQENFKLVTMGSYSYIKRKRTTGEEVKYPLFASGSWKPFGNNNMDSGIMAYLQCFEDLRVALQASFTAYFHRSAITLLVIADAVELNSDRQSPRFEIPHRISKDCLVHGSMEYSAKMLLNSEERWTKAMKLLLTNLRATIVQISAMRPSGV
ncbi:hypothetical protein ANCDUO_09059 [Ancylostoma duodenale]|uniref:Atg6 BARA domain-containing protein n=1 Tax=Ancylostoma duodenale TaxID=51022 RepID=A0A0C2GNL1_9BILA|nr:hypothetical protein ANCDUO_09059 [Ancylostoma duodenale]